MKLKTLIWLGPFIFLIHDLEEVFTVESWIREHQTVLDKFAIMKDLVGGSGYTTTNFGLTVAFLFTLFCLISYSVKERFVGWGMKCFLAAVLILFVNVFTHVGQSILFGMYTPGVVTAVIVVLPYTITVFRSLKRNQLLKGINYLHVVGLSILFLPFIFAPLLIMSILF